MPRFGYGVSTTDLASAPTIEGSLYWKKSLAVTKIRFLEEGKSFILAKMCPLVRKLANGSLCVGALSLSVCSYSVMLGTQPDGLESSLDQIDCFVVQSTTEGAQRHTAVAADVLTWFCAHLCVCAVLRNVFK